MAGGLWLDALAIFPVGRGCCLGAGGSGRTQALQHGKWGADLASACGYQAARQIPTLSAHCVDKHVHLATGPSGQSSRSPGPTLQRGSLGHRVPSGRQDVLSLETHDFSISQMSVAAGLEPSSG